MVLKNLTKGIFVYFTLLLLVCISTFILWLPFIAHSSYWLGLKIAEPGMNYVYRHFDGPLYIIPAKTWYDPAKIDVPGEGLIIELPLSAKYFAAHLPLYPAFIRAFSFIGYLQSMLVVNLLFTVLLGWLFYYVVKKLHITDNPFFLTVVLMFLPRFLVVRSVGAPESLFMFLILGSLYFFERKQYLWSGLLGMLSVMTKVPGILLFPAYVLVIGEEFLRTKRINIPAFLSSFLVPLGLFLVFGLYQIQYGDFFAFFHTGGVVPMVFPYSVFNYQQTWTGTAWLEEIVFYFTMYALAVYTLKDTKHRSFYYFSLVFLIATSFVQHRDISRYALPLWPFACMAFEKFFTSKRFMFVLVIILPALYLYGWDFLLYNVMPIANWAPYQ